MDNHAAPISRREFLKVISAGAGMAALAGVGLARQRTSKVAVIRQIRMLLGTRISITVHHDKMPLAERAIAEAFAAIERVDRVMSIHRADSDIAKVNLAAGRSEVAVDPMLPSVIAVAAEANRLTDGAYDVTCLPIMRMYGFYRTGGPLHYPSDRVLKTSLDAVGVRHLVVDQTTSRIGLMRKGAAIDLGSIGKGYAADLAGAALRAAGIEHGLIDAGGNVLAIGAPHPVIDPSGTWQVAIRNPAGSTDAPFFETVQLRDQAVATSGNYENSVVLDGRRVGHIFDAITARPIDSGISATVVAADATLSDALSTSAFLLGRSCVERLRGVTQAVYFHEYPVA
ncbi:MAG: FAD:protein FMN transferase [Deltaproteobacteria bacterium]|nr:FAD:protein FMN transferase [Deltaproteobacteria bacterium]